MKPDAVPWGGVGSILPVAPAICRPLSAFPEGLAVGALVLGGVVLVGAHRDPVQGAVVLRAAVVLALLDGAGDTAVGSGVAAKGLVHGKASSFDRL